MRRKHDFVAQVQSRIFKLEDAVQENTQVLRKRWIKKLDELFDLAMSIANPEKDDEKAKSATPKERQMWAQIATRVGEVMANLTKGFDERQFNEDLKELERQVDEIEKLQAQINKASDPEKRAEPERSEQNSNS